MASVVVVLFRPPDFTTNARHHKCLIFSKCSVSPTDFAEEAKKFTLARYEEDIRNIDCVRDHAYRWYFLLWEIFPPCVNGPLQKNQDSE
jgi:hypothetical protein